MIFLDAFFRFTSLGFLILLIIFSINKSSFSRQFLLLSLASASLGALLLGFSPSFYQFPFKSIIRFFDIPHFVLIWLFSLSLFQKDFRLTFVHFVIGITYCLPILIVRMWQAGWIESASSGWFVVSSLFSVLLTTHLLYIIRKGKQDDLLEERRKSRNYFIFVVVFVVCGTLISEVLLVKSNFELLYTVKAIIIWLAILWVCMWLIEIKVGKINFLTPNEQLPMTEKERFLLKRLEETFVGEELYLTQKLNINGLSEKIGVTPYSLRNLINKRLGYNNFSNYINSYRIERVKSELKDPIKRDVPILTIALSSGFNSLATFNKSFKDSEGITPSEYRKLKNCINP